MSENDQALVQMEEALKQRALQMQQNIKVSGSNISLQKNGRFALPGGDEVESLDMVVIDYRYRNQYFPKAFAKGQFNEATCMAIGFGANGLVPDPSVKDMQHPQCDGCPKNEFGSSANGQGKACQNQFLVAVMWPDLAQGEDIYVLKASPTAAKQVGGLVLREVEQSDHPIKCITRFTIDLSKDYPKLVAAYAGPNPNFGNHFKYLESAGRALQISPSAPVADAEKGVEAAAEDTGRQSSGRSRVS